MRKCPAPGCCGPSATFIILSASGLYSDSTVMQSSPGRYVVLPERRDVVPILGEEKVLEVRVSGEDHSQHLVRLSLVVLGARPDFDESRNRRIVSLGPLGEGDNYRLLAGLRYGPYEVD